MLNNGVSAPTEPSDASRIRETPAVRAPARAVAICCLLALSQQLAGCGILKTSYTPSPPPPVASPTESATAEPTVTRHVQWSCPAAVTPTLRPIITATSAGIICRLPDSDEPLTGSGPLLAEWNERIPESYVDLDSGVFGESEEADLVFEAGGGTDLFYTLRAVNGASADFIGFFPPDMHQPGPDYCAGSFPDFTTLLIPQVTLDTTVCVCTPEGGLSIVRVDGIPDEGPYGIQVSFRTWH